MNPTQNNNLLSISIYIGLTLEQEDALKNAQQLEAGQLDGMGAEMESKELEDRRQNIQQWVGIQFVHHN